MSIFTGQSERFQKAVTTFDPFQGYFVTRFIDPPGSSTGGVPSKFTVPYWRVALTMALGVLPVLGFNLVPNITFGGQLRCDGGLASDFGFWCGVPVVAIMLVVLLIGRRALGDLINELELMGVTKAETLQKHLKRGQTSRGLAYLLDWATRPTLMRQTFWAILFFAFVIGNYYFSFIDVKRHGWGVSAATPGSMLYFLRWGPNQPNLAGIWANVIVFPAMAWMYLLVARLLTCHALICRSLADDPELTIVPTHPDGAGGLLAVGQTSLFLFILPAAVGVLLANITVGEVWYLSAVHNHLSRNFIVICALATLYFVVAPILFLLPLLPLRFRMIRAKRRYLANTLKEFNILAEEYESRRKAGVDYRQTIAAQGELGALLLRASEMSVWPFDRKTFLRFGGTLATPVVALIVGHWSEIVYLIKAHSGGF